MPVGLVGVEESAGVEASGVDDDDDAVDEDVEPSTATVEEASVKGWPTRPAAAKPTPTEATAKAAHRATSTTRLSTTTILP